MKIEKLNEEMKGILDEYGYLEHDEKEILSHEEWENKLYELKEKGLDYEMNENGEKVYFQEKISGTFTDEEFNKAYKILLLKKISSLEEKVNTVKWCNVWFTVLTIISVISAIVTTCQVCNFVDKLRWF